MPDAYVKYLRQNQTPAEARLWFQLRRKRIAACAFRRQHRLDRYIVDFVCLSARLVIEVDGPSHDITVAEDAHRTRRLEAQGFRIPASPTPRSSPTSTPSSAPSKRCSLETFPRPLWAGARGRGPAPAGAPDPSRAPARSPPPPTPAHQGRRNS
jgi:hypothetical protein